MTNHQMQANAISDSLRQHISVSKRMLLAALAMLATWVIFIAAILILGSLEVAPLAGWSAIFASFSLVVFVPILIGFPAPTIQLRFWWLMIAASEVWGVVLLRFFLGVPLLKLFRDGLFAAVLLFSAASSVIYLLGLRWIFHRFHKSPQK